MNNVLLGFVQFRVKLLIVHASPMTVEARRGRRERRVVLNCILMVFSASFPFYLFDGIGLKSKFEFDEGWSNWSSWWWWWVRKEKKREDGRGWYLYFTYTRFPSRLAANLSYVLHLPSRPLKTHHTSWSHQLSRFTAYATHAAACSREVIYSLALHGISITTTSTSYSTQKYLTQMTSKHSKKANIALHFTVTSWPVNTRCRSWHYWGKVVGCGEVTLT